MPINSSIRRPAAKDDFRIFKFPLSKKQPVRKAPNTRPRYGVGDFAFVRMLAIHKAAGRRVVIKGILCSAAHRRPRALSRLPSGPVYLAELASAEGEAAVMIVSEAHLEFDRDY